MRLYFDLETIQTQKQVFIDEVVKNTTHPKTMKKADTIEKWEKDQKPAAVQEALSKTVFDGGQGEIITFGYAIDDGPVKAVGRTDDTTEKSLLLGINLIFEELKMPPVWIGHNICGFDLRYLWKRFVVNGIKPNIKIPYDAKPWSSDVLDTMFEWAGTGSDKKSMDFVCKALGLEGKTGMDGSMVYQAWLDGKYTEIAEYCEHDVEMTRQIHKRLTFS
ncbi:MAG: ribonuclease H-like domain-containing protein [Desulfobacteraceae bacterium]|nr:ribonuclease H-like domain-containing protein [Desulfobacteraceae bacterium]